MTANLPYLLQDKDIHMTAAVLLPEIIMVCISSFANHFLFGKGTKQRREMEETVRPFLPFWNYYCWPLVRIWLKTEDTMDWKRDSVSWRMVDSGMFGYFFAKRFPICIV